MTAGQTLSASLQLSSIMAKIALLNRGLSGIRMCVCMRMMLTLLLFCSAIAVLQL